MATTLVRLAETGELTVRACDLEPMAKAIRSAEIREPEDIAKIGDEMVEMMQKVNAWYATHVDKSDSDRWMLHLRHRHYTEELKHAIKDIIRRPDALGLTDTIVTPSDRFPSCQTSTPDPTSPPSQGHVQIELKRGLSNVMRSIVNKENANVRHNTMSSRHIESEPVIDNSVNGVTVIDLAIRTSFTDGQRFSTSTRRGRAQEPPDDATLAGSFLSMSNVTLDDTARKEAEAKCKTNEKSDSRSGNMKTARQRKEMDMKVIGPQQWKVSPSSAHTQALANDVSMARGELNRAGQRPSRGRNDRLSQEVNNGQGNETEEAEDDDERGRAQSAEMRSERPSSGIDLVERKPQLKRFAAYVENAPEDDKEAKASPLMTGREVLRRNLAVVESKLHLEGYITDIISPDLPTVRVYRHRWRS